MFHNTSINISKSLSLSVLYFLCRARWRHFFSRFSYFCCQYFCTCTYFNPFLFKKCCCSCNWVQSKVCSVCNVHVHHIFCYLELIGLCQCIHCSSFTRLCIHSDDAKVTIQLGTMTTTTAHKMSHVFWQLFLEMQFLHTMHTQKKLV